VARAQKRRVESRWEEDNGLSLNPWPFVVIALVVGAIVGLAVLLSIVD
jgi:preprotein translocase subunit Sec61beta